MDPFLFGTLSPLFAGVIAGLTDYLASYLR